MTTENNGIIHIYRGNGKGKTTAAVGLACRALGRGRAVLFVQFLKSRETGEVASLATLGAQILRCQEQFGFVAQMTEDERAACRELHRKLLSEARLAMQESRPALIVLDEVLDAVSLGMLAEDDLRELIAAKPAECELVCTGHVTLPWLEEQAGYITEMQKHRHPYNSGVAAREGIEF
jgi:cob(I)alamin adenosyltransferase